jgi:uncharacterized protein DUF3551
VESVADMRKAIVGATILTLAATAAPAADALWCFRDFNGPAYSNCMFATAEQCFAAARIMGGVCERNQRPLAPPPAQPT